MHHSTHTAWQGVRVTHRPQARSGCPRGSPLPLRPPTTGFAAKWREVPQGKSTRTRDGMRASLPPHLQKQRGAVHLALNHLRVCLRRQQSCRLLQCCGVRCVETDVSEGCVQRQTKRVCGVCMPSLSRCHGESLRGTAVPHRQLGKKNGGASEGRSGKEAIKWGRGRGRRRAMARAAPGMEGKPGGRGGSTGQQHVWRMLPGRGRACLPQRLQGRLPKQVSTLLGRRTCCSRLRRCPVSEGGHLRRNPSEEGSLLLLLRRQLPAALQAKTTGGGAAQRSVACRL